MVKDLLANAGEAGLIPGSGRFPGGGHGNPLQYSCLENPRNRGAWQATVHRVTKSQTGLKRLSSSSSSSRAYRGEGNGDPHQYSSLENLMDRGAWRATVHGVTKSQTGLKRLSMHAVD